MRGWEPGGPAIGIAPARDVPSRPAPPIGRRRRRSHATDFRPETNVLEIVRKGEPLTFQQWAELLLENYSKPPLRTAKTHEANTRAVTHLRQVFGGHQLADLSGDAIEGYLRYRLSACEAEDQGGDG